LPVATGQPAAGRPEALSRPRRCDGGEKWYTTASPIAIASCLDSVVQQAFASSWGDKGLVGPGRNGPGVGRLRRRPLVLGADRSRRAAAGHGEDLPGYPDTKLDLAMVRARLVLVSILEGDASRGREELAELVRLHPAAHGQLGRPGGQLRRGAGRVVGPERGLAKPAVTPDWPTFAGAPGRNKIAPQAIDVADAGAVAWRMPLFKNPRTRMLRPSRRFG